MPQIVFHKLGRPMKDLISFQKTSDYLVVEGKYLFHDLDVQRLHYFIMNAEDYIPHDLINMNKLTIKNEHSRKTFTYRSFSADADIVIKSTDIENGKKVSIHNYINILMFGMAKADMDWTIENAGLNKTLLTCEGKVEVSGLMEDRIEKEMRRMCNHVIENVMTRFHDQKIEIL